jgi:cytoskeletal protein CcmA (bactofilin family)
MYSYSQTDPTLTNITVNTSASTPATIQYLSGSMSCGSSGSVINGNVILGQGSAALASGCTINGDLFASGTINLQSATVTGNVTAANGTYPSVDLANSATVNGNVYAGGPVRLMGRVGGSVIAGPTAGSSSLSGSVGGSVVAAGTVSNSGTVTGTITQNKAGIVTPTIPYVPGWVDYPYAASDWTPGGFTELVLTDCTSSGFTSAMNAVLASTTPYVLNALACAGGVDLSALSSTTTLKSDLAIIAISFKMSNNNFVSSSSSGPHRKLWFITPDRGATANQIPNCPSGGSFTMSNRVSVGSQVDALIYSPCVITNSANVWQGQIYAAGTKTSNAFTLNYVPIGIPGVNLSTGQVNPPGLPGTGTLGSRTSIRNITG